MLYIKYISTCVHLQTGRANLLFWVGKFINSKLLVLVCKKDVCKCGEKEIVVQLWMTDWTDWLQVTSWKVMKKDWENEWKIKSCSHWNFFNRTTHKSTKRQRSISTLFKIILKVFHVELGEMNGIVTPLFEEKKMCRKMLVVGKLVGTIGYSQNLESKLYCVLPIFLL